ncbi:MAG: hypothetical protein CFE43_18905 [Burkholderiales bacterium PBB3]|nr:MAG: hypothetical protein CFE43_18905 [Burkholderiales bacterium PBB3]
MTAHYRPIDAVSLIASPALSTAYKAYLALKRLCATALGTALVLAACAVAAAPPAPPSGAPLLQAFSSAPPGRPPAPWRAVGLPDKTIPLTDMQITRVPGGSDNTGILQLRADKSYGTLSHALAQLQPTTATRLGWRWRLDQAVAGANLRQKAGDDAALKVCAMFDMPLERLGLVERSLMRLARARSGELLPAATLCYVWDPALALGTLLPNAYTARVRYLVLNSAESALGQWHTHQRNLHADFLQAFGTESATVPPLLAIVVGADADNTGHSSLAFVGDLVLVEQ